MTEAELLRLAEAMYVIDSNRCSHWPTERLREAAQSIGMDIDGVEVAIWWDAQCAYGQVWCAHHYGPQEPRPVPRVQPVQLSLFAETAQK